MLGICVIWIITSALNDVDAMLRKDLNTSTILRGDMDHCKRSKEDKYSCWIGQPILQFCPEMVNSTRYYQRQPLPTNL